MEKIPSDAAMVYLGAIHKLRKGLLPISTGIDGLVEVSAAYGRFGVLYSPKILRVIKDVYEANLSATREDGGVIPGDRALAAVHKYLSGGKIHNRAYRRIIKAFQESCKRHGVEEADLKIYASNPLIAGVYTPEESRALAESTISGKVVSYEDELCVGTEMRSLTKEQAKVLQATVDAMKTAYAAAGKTNVLDDVMKYVEPFAKKQGEINTFEELIFALSQQINLLQLESCVSERVPVV